MVARMANDSAVSNILKDRFGAIIVSVILGLGLAAIFRATCSGDKCVIVHSPPRDQIDKHLYRIDDHCYKYSSYAVSCPGAAGATGAAGAAGSTGAAGAAGGADEVSGLPVESQQLSTEWL